MSITRRARRQHYLQLDQSTVDDMSISLEAKGLLVYLLGRPDNWTVSPSHLRKVTGVGRDKLYRILRELITGGYCKRTIVKDPNTHRIKSYDYEIYEEKHLAEPLPEKPCTEKPYRENKHTNYKGLITNTDKEKEHSPPNQPAFDDFWALWPKKVDKIDAEIAWNKAKITQAVFALIVSNLEAHATAGDWAEDWTYCQGPVPYIKKQRWNNAVYPPKASGAHNGKSRADTRSDIANELINPAGNYDDPEYVQRLMRDAAKDRG